VSKPDLGKFTTEAVHQTLSLAKLPEAIAEAQLLWYCNFCAATLSYIPPDAMRENLYPENLPPEAMRENLTLETYCWRQRKFPIQPNLRYAYYYWCSG
jgi:hypothetical protein